MDYRVIVDENAGPGSPLWQQFLAALNVPLADCLFLKDVHPGIPDVEILDKLLTAGIVLVTADRVLHMQAIEKGNRSYTLNERGQLTRHPLPGVQTHQIPASVQSELLDSYHHRATNDIASRLTCDLPQKSLKRYRTARRRIRSHFGSAAAISSVSMTIGSTRTPAGLMCGFVMNLSGNSGVPGLRAREGYSLPMDGSSDVALPIIHALRDLYILQFEQVWTELFVITRSSLQLANELLSGPEPPRGHDAVLWRMMSGIERLKIHPCEKGHFFDSMTRKLHQLSSGRSNEITTLDLTKLAANLLGPAPEKSHSRSGDSEFI